MVDRFNTDNNIWEEYTYLKIIFKDLYNSDKSKNKTESSNKLWAIAFFADPSSKWRNLSKPDKIKYITEDFIIERKLKFDLESEEAKKLIEKWQVFVLNKNKNLMQGWEDKLEERTEFIKSHKYSADTYEMLDKMMGGSKKMWDEYLRILKDVSEDSGDEGLSMGGTVESASERHQI